MTYSNRKMHYEVLEITEIRDGAITAGSTGMGVPDGYEQQLYVGERYLVEMYGPNQPAGIVWLNGNYLEWIYRKTDEELDALHNAMMDSWNDRKRKFREESKADWYAREMALPAPLRDRLDRFRSNSADFDWESLPYELVVSELAVLMYDSNGVQTEEIKTYLTDHGVSGNQYGFARALAAALRDDPDKAAGAVSALAVITGKPDY